MAIPALKPPLRHSPIGRQSTRRSAKSSMTTVEGIAILLCEGTPCGIKVRKFTARSLEFSLPQIDMFVG